MIDERHPVDRVGVSAEGLSTASSGNALIRYMRIGLRRYWAILALVAVWQAWVSLQDVNRLVMPSPSDVYADFVSAIAEYVGAVLPTAASAVVGLLLGTMIGAGLALLAPLWKVVTGMATPSLIILRSIPIVMIVPILTKVFSPGRSSVYAITTLIALFPAFVLVTSALSALPMAMDQVAVAFGSSKWRRLRYIHAPAAVPAIFTAPQTVSGTGHVGSDRGRVPHRSGGNRQGVRLGTGLPRHVPSMGHSNCRCRCIGRSVPSGAPRRNDRDPAHNVGSSRFGALGAF